jgi:hypothetical protein
VIRTDDSFTVRRYDVVASPGCADLSSGCAAAIPTDSERSDGRYLPHAGAALRLGSIELGYRFQLDTRTPASSVHGLSLGLNLLQAFSR